MGWSIYLALIWTRKVGLRNIVPLPLREKTDTHELHLILLLHNSSVRTKKVYDFSLGPSGSKVAQLRARVKPQALPR
jgi:hypothetical protein